MEPGPRVRVGTRGQGTGHGDTTGINQGATSLLAWRPQPGGVGPHLNPVMFLPISPEPWISVSEQGQTEKWPSRWFSPRGPLSSKGVGKG